MMYGDRRSTVTLAGEPAWAGTRAPFSYLTFSVAAKDFRNASLPKSGANRSVPFA
jgi:hypothetical protein